MSDQVGASSLRIGFYKVGCKKSLAAKANFLVFCRLDTPDPKSLDKLYNSSTITWSIVHGAKLL